MSKFHLKPPATPKYLYEKNVDQYDLQFRFLPQVLKYYALKGWSLDHPDKSKNINHLVDFQVGVTICRHFDPALTDNLLSQQWASLVYIWSLNSQVDLESFLQHIKISSSEETWWNKDTRKGNGIREHLTEYFGKDKAVEIILAVSSFGTFTNGIVGLEYIETFGKNLQGQDFGETSRERIINYLAFLINKFYNYQMVQEEHYEPETQVSDIIKMYNKSTT